MSGTANKDWQQQLYELMQKYGWGLVSCTELWQCILAEYPDGIHSAAELNYAAKGCYGPIQYAGCGADDKSVQQECAFTEVHQYAYRLALKALKEQLIRAEQVEDLAQDTIALIYLRLAYCQNPKTFSDYCYQQFRTMLRDLGRYEVRTPSPIDGDITHLVEFITLDDPGAELDGGTLGQWQCIDEALQRLTTPKARAIIIYSYLYGWSSQEIAMELGITANNVNVLKSRALEKLRGDQALYTCLNET